MPSYTTLYPCNVAAPYAPAVWQGGWDLTGSVAAKVADGVKWGGTNAAATRAETSATSPYRMGVLRTVTRRLAPQTIGGTFNVIRGVSESDAAADFYFRYHLYVVDAADGSVLGTLLTYEEASGSGTEFPTTNTGQALAGPQALSSLVVPAGNFHLVIEEGVVSYNAVTTSRTATVRYGARTAAQTDLADLTVGSTSTTTLAGLYQFSTAIVIADDAVANLTPQTAIALDPLPLTLTLDPDFLSSDLWFRIPAGATDRVVSVFAGVSSAAGDYDPFVELWASDGGGGYAYVDELIQARVRILIIAAETFLRVYHIGSGTVPGRDLVVAAREGPTTTVPDGAIFISPDSGAGDNPVPGIILDPGTGDTVRAIQPFANTETGAIIQSTGRMLVSDKNANDTLHLYQYDAGAITWVSTITSILSATGQANAPINVDGISFYVAQRQAGGTSTVWQLDGDGAILATWTLATDAVALGAIAVAADVLYYAREVVASGIHRHDLVADSPLSDLAAAGASEKPDDIEALSDGTILVAFKELFVSNVIRRYSAAGALLNTYDFTGSNAAAVPWFIDHFRVVNATTFLVWFQTAGDANSLREQTYRYVDVATGATISEFAFLDFAGGMGDVVPEGDLPDVFFRPENSCPLLILGAGSLLEGVIGPLVWVHFPRRVPEAGSP